jgi:glutamyl-tRNA synthetase
MVITRFAPSPTGSLHFGSVRTALYCWLYAQKQQGKFILRIEDTDRERSTDAAIDLIFEGLTWLGLTWEGTPIYQTQRMSRYQTVLNQLLENQQAYRCSCSKERLEALRVEQIANKQKPRYDGHCRDLQLSANTPHVIRFKNPQSGQVAFDDLIRGSIEISNHELDDLVLCRSDGNPTYNFCVVVDDWDMQITHVLRGDDHINNTPRQINILKALKAPIPQYGHMPMILGPDGKKLSKRHGAVSVLEFKQQGILPQALLNYMVRLGWAHGDQEIFTLAEMIELFDIKAIHAAASAFNPEKLLWLNQHYLKTEPPASIVPQLALQFEALQVNTQAGPPLEAIVVAQRERVKTLKEMAERSLYFYQPVTEYDASALKQHITAQTLDWLVQLKDALNALVDWTPEEIHGTIKRLCGALGIGFGKVAQPIRIAITGSTVSPSIDITLALVGKATTLQRIDALMTFMDKIEMKS